MISKIKTIKAVFLDPIKNVIFQRLMTGGKSTYDD